MKSFSTRNIGAAFTGDSVVVQNQVYVISEVPTLTSSSPFLGERIWCRICKAHTQFVSIHDATRLAAVSRRSIYRYIEAGKIQTFKLAGTGQYRVCTSCLIQDKRTE